MFQLNAFRACLVLAACTFYSTCIAQYYLRGDIKDANAQPVSGATIYLFSKGTIPFTSGNSGGFGIPTPLAVDTITITKYGFETLKIPVETKLYQRLVLKPISAANTAGKYRLNSFIKSVNTQDKPTYFDNGESYNQIVDNPFLSTKQFPETGFGVTVDRAAYSNIRRFINMKNRVPPDAVRVEEMLNYFSANNNLYDSSTEFQLRSELLTTPWVSSNVLLYLQVQAPKLDVAAVTPSNFVFLIDVSGSMDKPNRLPLVQSGLKLLTKNLRDKDSVSIVVYGGDVGVLLHPTSGGNKEKIIDAIEQLVPGGATPGEAALRTAYKLASSTFIPNGNNRIILATDGDFNVGQTTEKELEDLIIAQRNKGIYLTCLGVGMGNYKDSKLEALAKSGNGNFAYLDNLKEAEKVLVTEFTKTLYAVANDAFINVVFNPQTVANYRLIGFDNNVEALKDSAAKLEGGEVGTGHTLTAIFELELANTAAKNSVQKLGDVKLQYQLPNSTEKRSLTQRVEHAATAFYSGQAPNQLATVVAMFGGLLRNNPFMKTKYTWDELWVLAQKVTNSADPLQAELVVLIEKAKKLYAANRTGK
ncbi:MAG: DUF3520 domain-containing protein [Bacteroidetes bacterium]|nr:MAG: DUF3520 domain-containing protein [Bacteroidota bacterium]TAF93091.1 MAG: DUF3520 domain-containing protein [Bacteroidota bacterium]